jgi:regulator of RNase E activity RraA
VHVEAIDLEVTVHGMVVHPGDLIHADRHGAVVLPPVDRLAELLLAIDLVTRREAPILAAARQAGFGIDQLRAASAEADEIH